MSSPRRGEILVEKGNNYTNKHAGGLQQCYAEQKSLLLLYAGKSLPAGAVLPLLKGDRTLRG